MSERVQNWTANQLSFMYWLATPKFERKPHTQGEFAKTIKVTERTLSRWKKLEGFDAEVNRIARHNLKKHVPDVLGALAREAKAGSFQHLQLFLKIAEEYEESVNLNVDDKREKVIKELSEFEQRRRAQMAG